MIPSISESMPTMAGDDDYAIHLRELLDEPTSNADTNVS